MDGDGDLPEGLTVRDPQPETRPVGDSEPRIIIQTKHAAPRDFRFLKMLRNMDIPRDIGDVPVGLEVWADNLIQMLAEPDLGI